MDAFTKDTAPHHIGTGTVVRETVDEQMEKMLKDIEEVLVPPEVDIPLPEHVTRFTGKIRSNFLDTAVRLRDTAAKFRDIAANLEARAEDIDKAAPDVANHVERWIRFERESADIVKFYATVPQKG